MITRAIALAAFVTHVTGHGFLSGFRVNDQFYPGWNPSYQYNPSKAPAVAGWATTVKDEGFVAPQNYSSPDIICHEGAQPAPIAVSVPAGATLDLLWSRWPKDHHGPVLTSLARCTNACANATKTELRFFPIHASGLDHGHNPGTWATDALVADNSTTSVTIPSDIASGEYVLRHEIIALHVAFRQYGAQNYPQCISLNITNGGTASPAGVGAQQLYSPTDPGIRFNLYTSFTTYPMPGPTVYQARPASRVGTDTPTTLLTAVSTAPRAASSDPAPVVVTATTVVTVLAPGATSAAPPPSSAATAPTSMPAAAPPLPSGVTKADVIAWLTSLILADAR